MTTPQRPRPRLLPRPKHHAPWVTALAAIATLALGAACDLHTQQRDFAGADQLCGGQPSPECPQW